jgi:hypothetical protein
VPQGKDEGAAAEAGPGTVDNLAMDYNEALQLLEAQVEEWRLRSYVELSREVGHWRRFETTGPSGEHYEGHVQVFWQGPVHGPVKVIGSIDDGGWRTFVPLMTNFTVTPDGTVLSQ